MPDPMALTGKVALVTGAGSGFGAAIATLFVDLGAQVVGADIDYAAASKTALAADLVHSRMVPCKADVSVSADMQACVDKAITTYGRLDIVVNNAGVTHRNQPMLEVTEDEFDRVMAVNVKSIYLSAVHAIPVLRANGGGAMVNIASTAGVRPRPGLTWYNGTKGAVITLTKSMAAEVAADGIRVNAVNPVMGETGMTGALLPGGDNDAARAAVVAGIPLGRLSQPLDVAHATAFLASAAAGMVTGTTLEVDGGRCI